MDDTKGKNAEELLESLNGLLEKMPGLIKRAEDLQISRRELEKEKANSGHIQHPDALIGKTVSIEQNSSGADFYSSPMPADSVQSVQEEADSNQDPLTRHAPKAIPQNHLRRVVFLYSEDCAGLLESFLKDADSVSLASKENPFFITRAIVRKTAGKDAPAIARNDVPSDVSGLVYLGQLSEDNEQAIYGICRKENMAFLHLEESSYSRNAILDFLIELIAIEKV